MQRAYALTFCFLIPVSLGSVCFHAWGLDWMAPFLTSRNGAPIVVLSFGPLIYLTGTAFLWWHMADAGLARGRFPPFLISEFENLDARLRWERISFLLTVCLPILILVYFWIAFHRGDAWPSAEDGAAVGLYQIGLTSPFAFFGHWNDWHFGQWNERAIDDGVSFVPLWQPVLIMWPQSLVVLLAAGLTARRVYAPRI